MCIVSSKIWNQNKFFELLYFDTISGPSSGLIHIFNVAFVIYLSLALQLHP